MDFIFKFEGKIKISVEFIGMQVSTSSLYQKVVRYEVDELALKAVRVGGSVFSKSGEQGGWMYGCGFADPDGHRWNSIS